MLVEDEPDLADSLAEGLRGEGYQTSVVYDGQAAMAHLAAHDVDLVILDRDLPVMTGDAVCRLVRAQGLDVSVLMLTAASTINDRVTGLDLGADDYLTKPFAYVELLARLRALSRRSKGDAGTVYEWGDIRLDLGRRIVERGGIPLGLTPKEYGILEVLLVAQGGLVTVDELLDEVWGSAQYNSRGVVKSAMYTMRQKLGARDPVEGVSGRGYRLVDVS